MIRSGTCESNGMNMVGSKLECELISKAFRKTGFIAGYHDQWNAKRTNKSRVATALEVKTLSTLWAPFGCLFKDDPNSEFEMYWAEPFTVQPSFPCGSSGKGIKLFCFCSKRNYQV